jgi:hypothetical protein
LATAPVPIVEMLGGNRTGELTLIDDPVGPSLRRTLLGTARESMSYLMTGVASSKNGAPLPRDIGLLRAMLWECTPAPPRVSIGEMLFDVASYVNPLSTRERAGAFWKAVRGAKCVSRLSATDGHWLELFEAVGARDASRMATLGSALVDSREATDDMRAYALMAAMTGLLGDGNALAAQRLLKDALPKLSQRARQDPALRILALLAETHVAPQAALTQ